MKPRNVLITGVSSGIGRALALELAGRGWIVYGTVRSSEDDDRLRAEGADRIVPVRLDLCDPWLVGEAGRWVDDRVGAGGLQAVIHNAGIALTGPMEQLSAGELRRQFEVNVVGAVALSRVLLPSLRRGGGRIVSIGSSSGQVTLPFAGAYSASKAALAAVTAALRMELAGQGIAVSLVEAGNIRTPIWEKTVQRTDPAAADARYRTAVARARQLTERMSTGAAPPRIVVRAVVRALESKSPRAVYVVGRDARAWRAVARWVPQSWLQRFLRRAFHLGDGSNPARRRSTAPAGEPSVQTSLTSEVHG